MRPSPPARSKMRLLKSRTVQITIFRCFLLFAVVVKTRNQMVFEIKNPGINRLGRILVHFDLSRWDTWNKFCYNICNRIYSPIYTIRYYIQKVTSAHPHRFPPFDFHLMGHADQAIFIHIYNENTSFFFFTTCCFQKTRQKADRFARRNPALALLQVRRSAITEFNGLTGS